ncbi:MAG: DNA-formamidopyrimidine glycosylase family protein [Planctomycetota bacterium]
MPELPEVECWGRRKAEKHCVGRKVVAVHAPTDPILFKDASGQSSAAKFKKAMKGRTIEACHRRGKQMWWTMSPLPPKARQADVHPLWHFGMTGAFHAYATVKERPKFLKCELTLDDGTRFGFSDPRRFGRIRLRRDPIHEPPLSDLGPDPIHEPPTAAWFMEQFGKRKTPIKALLLNQKFLAGVGNWIADEVAFQSRIDPHRPAHELTASEAKRLRTKLLHILNKACDWEADYERFPKSWLFHDRWGKDESAITHDGLEIAFSVVGGRTTAWVPAVQV